MNIATAADLSIVCHLGSFHTLMNFLGAIGYNMKGSGIEELLGLQYGPSTVDHVMSGKAFARALRSHFIVHDCLVQLLLQHVSDESQRNGSVVLQVDGDCSLDVKDVDILIQLYSSVWKNKVDVSDCSSVHLQGITDALLRLKVHLALESRTARLWLQYMDYVDVWSGASTPLTGGSRMLPGKSWGGKKSWGEVKKNNQLVRHSYWNCYSSNTNAVPVGCFFTSPQLFFPPNCSNLHVSALHRLESIDDPTTVTAAKGLLMRLQNFEVILSVHTLRHVLQVTGPSSRILQSVAADFAISTHLVSTCISKLEEMHREESLTWDEMLDNARIFASDNDIEASLLSKRPKKTPKRPGEQVTDERPLDPYQSFRVGVFYYALDTCDWSDEKPVYREYSGCYWPDDSFHTRTSFGR